MASAYAKPERQFRRLTRRSTGDGSFGQLETFNRLAEYSLNPPLVNHHGLGRPPITSQRNSDCQYQPLEENSKHDGTVQINIGRHGRDDRPSKCGPCQDRKLDCVPEGKMNPRDAVLQSAQGHCAKSCPCDGERVLTPTLRAPSCRREFLKTMEGKAGDKPAARHDQRNARQPTDYMDRLICMVTGPRPVSALEGIQHWQNHRRTLPAPCIVGGNVRGSKHWNPVKSLGGQIWFVRLACFSRDCQGGASRGC